MKEPFPAQREERSEPDTEVPTERRRVVPGKDVGALDHERVAQGLAGQRRSEFGPIADCPGDEQRDRDEGRNPH